MRTDKERRTQDKRATIERLERAGVDFTKDAFCLNGEELELLRNEAKRVHYRRPDGSYFGLAGAFYIHLKKYI